MRRIERFVAGGAGAFLIIATACGSSETDGTSIGATGGSAGSGGGQIDATPPDGAIETIAWVDGVTVGTLAGSDVPGAADGVGAAAQFDNPVNVVIDPAGGLVVSDFENGALRRVTNDGLVATLTSQPGFTRPFGLVFTSSGALVAQTDRNTLAQGGDTTGALWNVDPATGAATAINEAVRRPRGLVAIDRTTILTTDLMEHWVGSYTLPSSTPTVLAGVVGTPGFADGSGPNARFRNPYGVARLPSGAVVLADSGNHAIRIVTLDGTVSTLAGNGTSGMADGTLADARFSRPKDVAVDGSGKVWVSDAGNHRIRRIDLAAGKVETAAGDGVAGFADGPGATVRFFGQEGIDVTSDGKTLYVADGNGGDAGPYHRIRVLHLP